MYAAFLFKLALTSGLSAAGFVVLAYFSCFMNGMGNHRSIVLETIEHFCLLLTFVAAFLAAAFLFGAGIAYVWGM